MLIKPDADRLGINFDEFGKGILQAPPDGDSAADGQIQVGELLARHISCGIHGGSVLIHYRKQHVGAMGFNHIGDNFLYLVRACPVTHCDELYLIVFYRLEQRRFCFLYLMLINNKRAEILAGFV